MANNSFAFNPAVELSQMDFPSLIAGPLDAVIQAQNQAAMTTVNFIKEVGFDDDNKPVYISFNYPKEIAPFQPGNTGQIVGVGITNGGKDYVQGDVVSFTQSGATAAQGTIDVDATGKITGVNITNPGSNFSPGGTFTTSFATGNGTSTDSQLSPNVGVVASSPAVYQDMELEVPLLMTVPIPCIHVDEVNINFNARINSVEKRTLESDFGIKGSVAARFPRVKFKVSASYKRKSFQGIDINKTYSMNIDIKARQAEKPEGISRMLDIMEQAIVSRPVQTAAGAS